MRSSKNRHVHGSQLVRDSRLGLGESERLRSSAWNQERFFFCRGSGSVIPLVLRPYVVGVLLAMLFLMLVPQVEVGGELRRRRAAGMQVEGSSSVAVHGVSDRQASRQTSYVLHLWCTSKYMECLDRPHI